MGETAAEIRVVKRRKGHGRHHGGAWKVAYADFVTAMMAFFLVMWIMGLSKVVKQNVAGYFKDPAAYKRAVKAGRMGAGPPRVSERQQLAEAKSAIQRMVAATPEFESIRQYVEINLVDEGLRIDLLEAKESLFFDSASAQIKPSTRALLTMITGELVKLRNKVILEGHTDSRPLARTDGYTNWELSADRANSARRVMEAAGLKSDQIAQVRGYAATQPRNPENPEHFTNRRVSIIVVLHEALKKQQFGNVAPTRKQLPAH